METAVLTEEDKQAKIEQIKVMLVQNKYEVIHANMYRSNSIKVQALVTLQMEKQMLEHQLLILTGFKEAEVEKIIGDVQINNKKKEDDDDQDKQKVAA